VEIKATVDIKQPVERVFSFISDPRNSSKWISGVSENQKTTDGPLRKGSAGVQTRFILGRRLTSRWKIIDYEPNRNIRLEVTSGPFKGVRVAEATELLDPAGPVTRVTVTLEGQPQGASKLYGLVTPLLNRMFTRQVDTDLQQLRELLEVGRH